MADTSYSVSLEHVCKMHNFSIVYAPDNFNEIQVTTSEVGRPGLQITGFYDHFDQRRMQVLGLTEFAYFDSLPKDKFNECIENLFKIKPLCVVVARDLKMPDIMIKSAKENNVPLLKSSASTSEVMSGVIGTLNVELAPRTTRHGVLVEIYGEGVLLIGESGVGKSETAMELVKRGHRLIADDAVEIRRVSSRTLVGTSPENIRHFMELRGIGIINVRQIFGIGAVKVTQQIDMVISLEQWDKTKEYDRMGLNTQTTEILGNPVVQMTIPVKPGRNLAIIIEVAAMNHRQRLMGYNSAQDLLTSLGMLDEKVEDDPSMNKYEGW